MAEINDTSCRLVHSLSGTVSTMSPRCPTVLHIVVHQVLHHGPSVVNCCLYCLKELPMKHGERDTVAMDTPPQVLFLGSMYAGHRTRFQILRQETSLDPRIRPRYNEVVGWMAHDPLTRLLPPSMRGHVRSMLQAAPYATLPRPDAVWCSVGGNTVLPYLWSQRSVRRRLLIYDHDWTVKLREEQAPMYYGRSPRHRVPYGLSRLIERFNWSNVTIFTPWSNWAADSLREHGVKDERIRVMPPGIDLERWYPHGDRHQTANDPLRLLFVGGDFVRKGGPMLVDVIRERFSGRCELDIVTYDDVSAAPGIRVHRAEPNSQLLRDLYARAELFVLPTRAEAFGLATVEALASGIPVVVSDIGGVRDIVDDEVTGWLIQPTPGELVAALERALA
jgi:glycosyltransferase involved in cell wall biosynthesis